MKTDLKASTTDCGLCHKAHSGYHVTQDSKGVQYVLCGSGPNAKRVNVVLRDPKSKNPYQPGKWTRAQPNLSGWRTSGSRRTRLALDRMTEAIRVVPVSRTELGASLLHLQEEIDIPASESFAHRQPCEVLILGAILAVAKELVVFCAGGKRAPVQHHQALCILEPDSLYERAGLFGFVDVGFTHGGKAPGS